ncbi:MAG: hypothetical protein ACRENB_03845 [Gemmatimonadales bacterium]
MLLWLLVFLGTAVAVVSRQHDALVTARRLGEIRAERTTLEARRTELLARIKVASGRPVLVPRAERMGLRFPDDSEATVLELTPPASSSKR